MNQINENDDYIEDDEYEPIGYDPEEFVNSMVQEFKATDTMKKELIRSADDRVRETKWALQRAGLPTDALQSVSQEIRFQADKLGINLPAYTDLILKMVVDNTLQRELRRPRKERVYTISSINQILQELDIKESCWESYYNVAGIAV